MIDVKARSRQDGWAFAEEDGTMYLLYPPYRTRRAVRDARAIERAITVHGFSADAQRFDDWPSVVKVLSDEYVEAAASRTTRTTDVDLLRDAPVATLRQMVSRVVDEFIPAGDLDAGEKLLVDVLTTRDDDVLRADALAALRQITDMRERNRKRMADLLDMTALIRELAPMASERYTAEAIQELANAVRERGLWSMAA